MLVIYIHFRREQWPQPFFFFCRRDQKNNYSVSIIIVFSFVFFPFNNKVAGDYSTMFLWFVQFGRLEAMEECCEYY
jgi:hypothetical protein